MKGFLGTLPSQPPMPILGTSLVLMRNVTQAQAGGRLWLSPVLGARFLVPSIASATIPITGHNEDDDERIGTGIALTDTDILTCAHVVDDMRVAAHLTAPGWIAPFAQPGQPTGAPARFPITGIQTHRDIDVAVITVDPGGVGLPHLGGLTARDPEWAETVHVIGYPPVPFSQQTALNAHIGEVVQPQFTTYDGRDLFLYSATARPGNSGGPIIAADGRLVGIVTRELADEGKPENLPFYSGVPARVITRPLDDLGYGHLLAVETWER